MDTPKEKNAPAPGRDLTAWSNAFRAIRRITEVAGPPDDIDRADEEKKRNKLRRLPQ